MRVLPAGHAAREIDGHRRRDRTGMFEDEGKVDRVPFGKRPGEAEEHDVKPSRREAHARARRQGKPVRMRLHPGDPILDHRAVDLDPRRRIAIYNIELILIKISFRGKYVRLNKLTSQHLSDILGDILQRNDGAVAQLGERYNGIVEVRSSILLGSISFWRTGR